MAFTVRFNSGNQETWNRPQRSSVKEDDIKFAVWVQADGDELEHVRFLFSNGSTQPMQYTIPIPRGNIARWYGDIAKTILFSL